MKYNLKDSISKKLIYVGPQNTLDEAFCIMQDRGIRHLPVIAEDGLLLGILSDRDLQRAMKSVVHTDTKFRKEDLEFPEGSTVTQYMSWPVKSVDIDTEVGEVARQMIDNKISAVLVTEGASIVGIVTHEDLLKILCQILSGPGKVMTKVRSIAYDPMLNYMASVAADAGL